MQAKKYLKRKGILKLFFRLLTKSFDIPEIFETIKVHHTVYDLNDSFEILTKYNPDLIIHAGGGLINKSIIRTSNIGVLNCHPAPLPKYKGEKGHILAFNDGKAGVTIHYIDEGIDTGKIISSKEFKPLNDSTQTKRQAMLYGIDMVVEAVKKIFPIEFEDRLMENDIYESDTSFTGEKQK